MATLEQPIGLGMPDTSGQVYPSKLNSELTLTNSKEQECMVMPDPTGSDIGVSIAVRVPQNYAGSPVLVIRGILDGTPANTMAFGVQQLERDVNDSIDTAYEAEDTASNGTWAGYADEDEYEETIALTPSSAYTPGRTIYLWIYRDNSADTTSTLYLLVTGFYFQYSDT